MTAATKEDEDAVEATKAPLLDHLLELRRRLIYSILAFAASFFICFFFAKQINGFLTLPLENILKTQQYKTMIATGVTETFFTYMKVGMFAGLCLAFPVIAAQVWFFVAPGLYRNERRAFLPFLVATPALFVLGASFVIYVMLPFALRALVAFDTPGEHGGASIQFLPKVSEYFDFVTTLVFAFGLTFQMPVLLSLLGRVGIVTSRMLRDARRYSIVGITAVAAVLTPPDVFSMVSLIVPLVLLYEISIGCVWLIERGRKKAEAEG